MSHVDSLNYFIKRIKRFAKFDTSRFQNDASLWQYALSETKNFDTWWDYSNHFGLSIFDANDFHYNTSISFPDMFHA